MTDSAWHKARAEVKAATDREQFEAWFEKDSGYSEYCRAICWETWQAARAAPAQPCPFGCTTQEEHDAHYAPAQPEWDEYGKVGTASWLANKRAQEDIDRAAPAQPEGEK